MLSVIEPLLHITLRIQVDRDYLGTEPKKELRVNWDVIL